MKFVVELPADVPLVFVGTIEEFPALAVATPTTLNLDLALAKAVANPTTDPVDETIVP